MKLDESVTILDEIAIWTKITTATRTSRDNSIRAHWDFRTTRPNVLEMVYVTRGFLVLISLDLLNFRLKRFTTLNLERSGKIEHSFNQGV